MDEKSASDRFTRQFCVLRIHETLPDNVAKGQPLCHIRKRCYPLACSRSRRANHFAKGPRRQRFVPNVISWPV